MSKEDLKNLNDLYFRWWKKEAAENEKLQQEVIDLKEEKLELKQLIIDLKEEQYENSIQTRGRTRKKVKKKKV